ncbi:tail protein X [uncultured Methylobacterium sp.]|uniref:tail protein X n=1 Tax=uncultured Methylobacterium sp. TaxID=157278 RepID=UPI002585E857|nr:tail protein X [uncultured Methylobacterium sp.]
MARKTTTTDEDRIDVIAKTLVGREGGGGLEAVLKANRGLAATGLFVPAGTRLTVPDPVPAAPVLPSINPWGD